MKTENPNVAVDEGIPMPVIGESGELNLSGCLAEKLYLQTHPSPTHGWSSGIMNRIETRLMTLNKRIADLMLTEFIEEQKDGK